MSSALVPTKIVTVVHSYLLKVRAISLPRSEPRSEERQWRKTYKALASAVISFAVKDAIKPEPQKRPSTYASAEKDRIAREKATARYFLLCDNSGWFEFWCGIAGLDPKVTREKARTIIRNPNRLTH